MGRRRRHDRHLPSRVYLEHGTYYFRNGKNPRVLLGRDLGSAMSKYGAMVSAGWAGRTIGDCIDRYRVEVLPLKRERTRGDQERELNRLRIGFGHMLPDNLTHQHCYRYMDARRSKDGKRVPVAARHEIMLLCHVIGKARKWGVCTTNGARGLDFDQERRRRAHVPMEQVEALKRLARERMRVAIDLAVSTGQRRGDLLSLTRAQLGEEGIRFRQSKTGAEVTITWSADLRAIVARAKALKPQIPGEYLLRTSKGKPYSARGFSAIWQRLMVKHVKGGGQRFTFHDLRSVSADGAATLEEAQARLGHRSSETTARSYRRAATKAPPRS